MNKSNKKILIIEDDQDFIDILTTRLYSDGYKNIIYALDGLEGLNIAKKVKPDLIILDVMLPRMDGYHICGYLKNDTRYNQIKIIMYTIKAGAEDLKIGMTVKPDVYLVKGMYGMDLLTTMNKLLEGKNEL